MPVAITEADLSQFFERVIPHLNERQRRVVTGSAARMLGRGGVAKIARAAGMSRSTVSKAVGEVDVGMAPGERVRTPGAGRKRLIDLDPDLLVNLDELVGRDSRGDPMSPLRWTAKSARTLAETLTTQGHSVSQRTVRELLVALDYRLQSTAKNEEGPQHPDRDGQFRYIAEWAAEHLKAGEPVISVDAKKKELVGNKANKGREYQPKGKPERVDVHDFPDAEIGKAIPYALYDLAANEGWVGVGDDHDTAAFAVHTIGRWWEMVGSRAYPSATRLLITADAGGSNSYRIRLWKVELAVLAARTGLTITVCHYPPGTSKWNKIEHRLFSAISGNWRGRPLESHEVVVNLIGATTNRKGLKVRAELDQGYYPTGVKVTDKELAAVPLSEHDWLGKLNYTIHPSAAESESQG